MPAGLFKNQSNAVDFEARQLLALLSTTTDVSLNICDFHRLFIPRHLCLGYAQS